MRKGKGSDRSRTVRGGGRRYDPGVFEYHGWIHVREAAAATDDDDEKLASMVDVIRRHIDQSAHAGLAELRYMNGTPFVHLGGFNNHRNDALVDLFARVGAIAPGSFGLLHVLDDEDPQHGNDVQVLSLVRGSVTWSTESRLSPCIPTLEDSWVEPTT